MITQFNAYTTVAKGNDGVRLGNADGCHQREKALLNDFFITEY